MKKVFAALAIVFGSLGLATLVLFFAMTPSVSFPTFPFGGFSLPGGVNLTADVATIVGGAAAEPTHPAGSQTAIVAVGFPAAPTAGPTPAATPSATATPAESTTAGTAASAPASKTTLTSETTPAPNATTEVPPPPVNTPASDSPQGSAATAPEFPVASTTITVTPAALTPPPVPAPVSPPYNGQLSNAAATLTLPFSESDFTGDTRWRTTWGKIGGGSALELSAGANSFGGAAYLDAPGAMTWTDYSMQAALTLDGGTSFTLMADYADASDYVACEYTADAASGTIAMQLAQYVKGYRTPLSALAAIPWNGSTAAALSASISVNGIYGTCGLNGATATNEGVGVGRAPMDPHGGGTIGFGVNDPLPAISAITVRSLTVNAQ